MQVLPNIRLWNFEEVDGLNGQPHPLVHHASCRSVRYCATLPWAANVLDHQRQVSWTVFLYQNTFCRRYASTSGLVQVGSRLLLALLVFCTTIPHWHISDRVTHVEQRFASGVICGTSQCCQSLRRLRICNSHGPRTLSLQCKLVIGSQN